jgi:predicted Zn-dependent protease
VRLAPKNPAGHTLLAQLHGSLKQPAEAYQAWTRVAALSPGDARAAFAAGVIALEQLKRLPEAEQWLRRAAQLETRDPRGPLMLGRALASRGKTTEAERVLVDGARRFPRVAEIYTFALGRAMAARDKAGAINALRDIARRILLTKAKEYPQVDCTSLWDAHWRKRTAGRKPPKH